jgi:hypothetical protein
MTDAEKDEASACHVCNPTACKYGYHAKLANPPDRLDYTPFFCCPIPLTVIVAKEVIYLVVNKVLSVCIWH